jgi:phosphatidate cytidylyltransferase
MTWKRIATAAVLIPVVVGLVLWASTAIVALVLALVMLLALFEYFALGDAMGHRAYRFWTATCALIILYLQWLTTSVRWGEFGGIIYPARLVWLLHRFFPRAEDGIFLFVIGVAVITLATKRPIVEALPSAGISSSGLLLVAFPLTYAIRLHALGREGPRHLLFVLVVIWVSDTVAYFVGRAIGKHPFAPHLSPKKTWEGSIAGFAGSIGVAFAFTHWLAVPFTLLLGAAAVGNIAGQAGDLLESAYKRSAGVKDSGSLLPGHGGILDRIDALILAIPVVWYYWILLYPPAT